MRILVQRCFSDGETDGVISINDHEGKAHVLDSSCGCLFIDLGPGVEGHIDVMAITYQGEAAAADIQPTLTPPSIALYSAPAESVPPSGGEEVQPV